MRDVDLEVAAAARHDEPMAQISEPDRAGRGLDLCRAGYPSHSGRTASVAQPKVAVDEIKLSATRARGDVRVSRTTLDRDVGAVADDLGCRPGRHEQVDIHSCPAHPAADQVEHASELGRMHDQGGSVHVDPDPFGQVVLVLGPPRGHGDDRLGQIVTRTDGDRADAHLDIEVEWPGDGERAVDGAGRGVH